ncbi:MAG: tetratricopeptide repeat protein [Planctomycetota bacterium]|jgi:tetratricopeptide (TPR) repeat protein
MKMTDSTDTISNTNDGDKFEGLESNYPGPAKSTDSWGRTELLIVLSVFFFALFIRFFYLYESRSNPTFEAPISDSITYHRLAKHLVEGRGMTNDFFWQPFFYPFFLTIVYYLWETSIVLVKNIQVILGAFTCVLSYFLAKRLFGRQAGILTAVIVSLNGTLIFFEAELLASGWASFWSVVLILLFLKAKETKSLLVCFAVGACGALSILTRPTFLLFFTAACLWLVITFYRVSKSKQFLVLRGIVILSGFAVISVPVASQCYHVSKHFGILPSSGGLNVYIGNNPDSEETIIIRPGSDWGELTVMPGRHGMGKNFWVRQQYFYQEVRNYIFSQPLHFCKGIARKTLQFFCSREMPRNVDIYLFRRWSGLLSILLWKAGGFGFPFGLLLPMAIIGLISRWRQVPMPVFLFLFFYAVAIILVFISARYRVPMVPVASCLAAVGICTIGRMLRLRQFKKLAVTTVCTIVIVLVSSFAGPFPEEQVNYEAELSYGLGYFASQGKQYERSIGHYQRAVELNPELDAAYNNLGLAQVKCGQIENAISNLEKALEIKPTYHKARMNLGLALMRQGKRNEALEHFKAGLKLAPWEVKVHNHLGMVLTELGKLDEANKHFKFYLRAKPKDIRGRFNFGLCLSRQGKYEQAIEQFSEILRLQPDHAGAHFKTADALLEQGRIEEALTEYSKTVQIEPNNSKAHYELAMIFAQQNQIDKAILHFSEVVRIKPENAEAHYSLGKAFAEQGRIKDAVKHYQQAAQFKSDSTKVLNSLAWIYATNENAELRNGALAVHLAKRACELTDYKNVNILDTLAAAYAEAGNFKEAVRTARMALQLAMLEKQKNLATKIRERLQLYKAGKPYRRKPI